MLKIKGGQKGLLNDMLKKYEKPIIQYLLFKNLKLYEAEDICQEIFLRLSSDNFLAHAEKRKGKFRTLVLCVVKHAIYDYRNKRPKDVAESSILNDASYIDGNMIDNSIESPEYDESFDKYWAHNLLQNAISQLKDYSKEKDLPYHEIIILKYYDKLSGDEIMNKLALEPKEFYNHTKYAVRKLKIILLELIKDYSPSGLDFEEEKETILKYINF